MELFKALNTYKMGFSITKSILYKEIEKHKKEIVKEGFSYHPKKIETIFDLEIIYKSIMNKQTLEETYYTFSSQQQDLLSHLNHQERQKVIQLEMMKVITTLVSFKEQENIIMIAYLETFINHQYITDIQLLALKKHQEYLREYPRKLENIKELYGMQPYISAFSSLQFLGEDGMHHYFYFQENRTVYIFDENHCICDAFCIVDQYHHFDPSLTEVKNVVKQILAIDNDHDVITYMHEQGFLSAKGYRKIKKKLGTVKS